MNKFRPILLAETLFARSGRESQLGFAGIRMHGTVRPIRSHGIPLLRGDQTEPPPRVQ